MNIFLNKYYDVTRWKWCSFSEKQAFLARKDGSIKTLEFWEDAIIEKNLNRNVLLKKLSIYFPILNKVFKDNWDIHWNSSNGGILPSIVIYFPEITITNSSYGNTHLIKGLGITLQFNTIGNIIPNLEGFRTHKTFIEQIRSYQHSHISSIPVNRNPMERGNFCLGRSEILDVFANLEASDPFEQEELHATQFEMLCLMIISHAETESEEGGPYFRISGLSAVSTNKFKEDVHSFYQSWFKKILDEYEIPLEIDFTFDGSQYVVKNNNKFKEWVKSVLLSMQNNEHLGRHIWHQMLVSTGPDGYEYSFSQEINDTINVENHINSMKINGVMPFTLINGEKIELTIDKPEKQNEISIENYNVAKNFLDYARTRIEERLNRNILKNTAIRRYNKIVFERVCNGQN